MVQIELSRVRSLLALDVTGHTGGLMAIVLLVIVVGVVAAVVNAERRSKREVERQVAALAPRPDVPSSVRKCPAPAGREPAAAVPAVPALSADGAPAPPSQDRSASALPLGAGDSPCAEHAAPVPGAVERPPAQRPRVAPLSADRYKVQFTVRAETVEKLRRLQDLMRHSVPDGDPAVIFDRAITVLLEQVERTRFAATNRPRTNQRPPKTRSRHIPGAARGLGTRRRAMHVCRRGGSM